MGKKRKNREQGPGPYGQPEIHQGSSSPKKQKTDHPPSISEARPETNRANLKPTTNLFSKADRAREIILLQAQLADELRTDSELATQYEDIMGGDGSVANSQLGAVLLDSKQQLLLSLHNDLPSTLKPLVNAPPLSPTGYLSSSSSPKPALPPVLDPTLLERVFTHRSAVSEAELHSRPKDSPVPDYERLEFIGDAYIGLAAARLLDSLYPGRQVGVVAHLREQLINNETLAEYTLLYGLDEKLRFGGHLFTHTTDRGGPQMPGYTKILGDVFEAYVAAVVASDPEHGYAAVEAWLHALWKRKLARKKDDSEVDLQAKADLARKLMGKGVKLEYRDIGQPVDEGVAGRLSYTVAVSISGWGWQGVELGRGKDNSKQDAGMRAAAAALANPLSAQIACIKREYDRLVAEERAREEGPREDVIKELDSIWKDTPAAARENDVPGWDERMGVGKEATAALAKLEKKSFLGAINEHAQEQFRVEKARQTDRRKRQGRVEVHN